MIGDTHRTEPMRCPGCGAEGDGHTAADKGDGGPAAGASCICWHCSTISIYVTVNGQLRLRRPTDTELDELLRDADVQHAITVVRVSRERQR